MALPKINHHRRDSLSVSPLMKKAFINASVGHFRKTIQVKSFRQLFRVQVLGGVFSEGDLENIRMHFSDMIRKSVPIQKQNMKEALEKEPWGNNLLKKVTLDTIFNRIKYERRVHRSSK